jgi:hypothetical protein
MTGILRGSVAPQLNVDLTGLSQYPHCGNQGGGGIITCVRVQPSGEALFLRAGLLSHFVF